MLISGKGSRRNAETLQCNGHFSALLSFLTLTLLSQLLLMEMMIWIHNVYHASFLGVLLAYGGTRLSVSSNSSFFDPTWLLPPFPCLHTTTIPPTNHSSPPPSANRQVLKFAAWGRRLWLAVVETGYRLRLTTGSAGRGV